MASMGLPVAFASSSDHRRAVRPEIIMNLKKKIILRLNNNLLFSVMWQPRQGKAACPTHYSSVEEAEEENEDDVQSDNEGNTILLLYQGFQVVMC